MRLFALVIVAALPALSSVPGQAQSFNCRYARSADEITICNSAQLSAMDEKLSDVFYRLRDRVDRIKRASLDKGEGEWLSSRKKCGREEACIAWHYSQRSQQIEALLQQLR